MSTAGRRPVTVILPVRNGEATLGRAVHSTLRALPHDGRLLVHDDASSDRTPEILAGVSDRRLEVLKSEQPRGVAGGLNFLLSRVETPLLARMDADDVTLPWRFRTQLDAIRRGADVVFSTVVGFGDVPGRVRPGPPIPISADAMPLHLLLSNPVAHSSMLASTETITSAGGYRTVPAEDYDLWLRLCGVGARCVRLGVPTILYRFHGSQLTAADGWTARSFADPALAASYASLGRRLLGREPDWYDDLHCGSSPSPDGRDRLARFVAELTSAAARLPRGQRWFLMQKVGNVLPSADAAG